MNAQHISYKMIQCIFLLRPRSFRRYVTNICARVMFTSCYSSTCGWKTGKWLSRINNGVEIIIPALPTRFEGFISLKATITSFVYIGRDRRHFPSMSTQNTSSLTQWVSAREKAHGKILPVTSASCWGKAPARRRLRTSSRSRSSPTISKRSGPVYQSPVLSLWVCILLCWMKARDAVRCRSAVGSLAFGCSLMCQPGCGSRLSPGRREAVWGITWQWILIQTYK